MFFKKSREAFQRADLADAAERLSEGRSALDDIAKLTDAGEKYYRLLEAESRVSGALGYPTLRDAAEAVTPGARKAVWKREGFGTAGLVGGALICATGGAAVCIGGPMILYGLLGCGAGGQRAASNKRNRALFQANRELIENLSALRNDVQEQQRLALIDMEAHPEKIAQSARFDDLLKIPNLRDAFTAAAKAHLMDKAPPVPPGPSRGFNL